MDSAQRTNRHFYSREAQDAASTSAGEPFGADGSGVGAVSRANACRCGAGPHPELDGRCMAGHVARGNSLALVTGQHTSRFWTEHAQARREMATAIIEDAGHTAEDAPRALCLAADAIAQAALLQASAFVRLVESGGPMTASGRTRRAFVVWQVATDRLERHLRLVGLQRRTKRAPTLADVMNGNADA